VAHRPADLPRPLGRLTCRDRSGGWPAPPFDAAQAGTAAVRASVFRGPASRLDLLLLQSLDLVQQLLS
jgi:hypothetical protein